MDLSGFFSYISSGSHFKNEKFSHAYIVYGSDTAGNSIFACNLAAAILCEGNGARPCMQCKHCTKIQRGTHPDIIIIDLPENKQEILVDQIRQIVSTAAMFPNEAEKKVYMINHADSMNRGAQNALLKLLEEPPSHTSFVLIAENPSPLLETVRSRCTAMRLTGEEDAPDSEILEITDVFFSILDSGDTAKLSAFSFDLEKLDRASLGKFSGTSKQRIVSLLKNDTPGDDSRLTAKRLLHIYEVLDRFDEYIHFNVGAVHICGMLCAELTDMK